MTDPLTPKQADDAEAAEYVLGLQDLAERSASEARLRRDPRFATLVFEWEARMAELNDDFAPTPAPNLMPAIEARLFPKPARRRGAGWGWLSGAVLASVLVLATVATLAPPRPSLVARLATADNRLAYEVQAFNDELIVTRTAGTPAVAGRVHELWAIAPGAAPVSLGLLADATLTVDYPRPPDGWTLAVSIEPEGGSAYGTPTGPVILSVVIGQDV
jgi:anti-sigma-K factor RskA